MVVVLLFSTEPGLEEDEAQQQRYGCNINLCIFQCVLLDTHSATVMLVRTYVLESLASFCHCFTRGPVALLPLPCG